MQTVVLPMTCEHCGSSLELDCEQAPGFAYMPSGWFRCPTCREINRCSTLPGAPISVRRAVPAR